MNQLNPTIFKYYINNIITNYSIETPETITKTSFTEFLDVPLLIGERFLEILFPSKPIQDQYKKTDIIDGLYTIYIKSYQKDINFLFKFLDICNKGGIMKNDLLVLLRSFNFNYNDHLWKEMEKFFGESKLLLLDEFIQISYKNKIVITTFCNFINNIKPLANFSFFVNNLIDKNILLKLGCYVISFELMQKEYLKDNFVQEEDWNNKTRENSINSELYTSNINLYNETYTEKKRRNSFSFNNINLEFIKQLGLEQEKINKKKHSFQIIETNLLASKDKKFDSISNKENESYSFFSFLCSVNGLLINYKFIAYNGYLFYFKYSINDNLFYFDGTFPINSTYLKKIESYQDENYPDTIMYQTSIISFVNCQSLSTKIFSYTKEEIEKFRMYLSEHSSHRKLKDNYFLQEEIGKGHFSKVYKAQNIHTLEIFACKVIDKKDINDENNMEMIHWEKEIFFFIKHNPHPNIVKAIDYYESSSYIYFIFEYLPKGIISTITNELLSDIINGLFYLHSNNIIHRDIKPENIMISSEGKAKITDFGLSKIQPEYKLATEPYGTLAYLAPEILNGDGYSNKCDIWSLGVLLYNLKYNALPFDDSNDNSDIIRNKILYEETIPNLNKNEDELIVKCLMKQPSMRPSIQEIITLINKQS